MTDSPAPLSLGASTMNEASSSMDHLQGILHIRVKRDVNLDVRDVRSSDPYCVIQMGNKIRRKKYLRLMSAVFFLIK
ncbi:Protein C2-DOMAIN ABA-RELATED 4 [Linum perenne]